MRDFAEATATQSHNLMITAATRVWEELYITKKPAIEEVSRVGAACLSISLLLTNCLTTCSLLAICYCYLNTRCLFQFTICSSPPSCALTAQDLLPKLICKLFNSYCTDYIWLVFPVGQVYKVSLSAGSGKAPELASVRDLVNEASQRLWLAFLEGEKKQYSRLTWEIPTQIQSVTNVRSCFLFIFSLYQS